MTSSSATSSFVHVWALCTRFHAVDTCALIPECDWWRIQSRFHKQKFHLFSFEIQPPIMGRHRSRVWIVSYSITRVYALYSLPPRNGRHFHQLSCRLSSRDVVRRYSPHQALIPSPQLRSESMAARSISILKSNLWLGHPSTPLENAPSSTQPCEAPFRCSSIVTSPSPSLLCPIDSIRLFHLRLHLLHPPF